MQGANTSLGVSNIISRTLDRGLMHLGRIEMRLNEEVMLHVSSVRMFFL